MLDETLMIKKYIAAPKWEMVKKIVTTAIDEGHRIEILVATADGGEIAGIPRHVVQGEMTCLNITPGATRYTVCDDEKLSIDTEMRFGGKATKLSLHVGVIADITVERGQVPFSFPCWPIEAVTGVAPPEPVIEQKSTEESGVSNIVPLFKNKNVH